MCLFRLTAFATFLSPLISFFLLFLPSLSLSIYIYILSILLPREPEFFPLSPRTGTRGWIRIVVSKAKRSAINRKFPIAAPLPSCCICLPVGWLARSLRDRPTYCVRVCARVVCVCVYFARSFIKIRADARVISSRHGVVLDFGESFYEERSVCVCVCLHVRAACLPFAKRAACRLVYPSPPSPSSTLLWRGVDDIYPFPRFSKNDLTLP